MITVPTAYDVDHAFLDASRRKLQAEIIDSGHHYRIMTIGRSINGSTDIVSCLVRSLRNLGHKVLHIDPKTHKGMLDNPDKLRGGMGPIFIRRQIIQEAIDRYKPQMIVVLAGGMTFTPEDADILRNQGIVLIGLTLSDPDVFNGAVTFAGNFDFHTTNALHSYHEYKKAGIQNTLLFPFAIDRGFVTQAVSVPAEFNADVICLGHATSRPERNDVMMDLHRNLGDRFKVQGYGRGWELPDARLVEGLDVIKAARGGKIHVNFPMTRAGFVNVKCGVFETIASGRLLATLEFDEMSRYFDYGSEIVGYKDFDDLGEKIESVLVTPGKAEWMAHSAFKRLINEHLYEHRWMALFQEIRDCIADAPEWLGVQRCRQMRDALEQPAPRAKIVAISGFYGANNVGDELILQSIKERVEEADPAAEVFAVSENASRVMLSHGMNAITRRNHHEADYLSTTVSSVILGGGGLWHDYTFERAGGMLSLFSGAKISIAGFGIFPLLAKMRGARFDVMGLGVGPLTNPDARLMVAHLAKEASSITVRDVSSEALLHEVMSDPSTVVCSPDTVYAVSLPDVELPEQIKQAKAAGKTVIGVNLRPWVRDGFDIEKLKTVIGAVLTNLADSADILVYGVPMQEGGTYDRLVLSELFATLPDHIETGMLPDPLTIPAFFNGTAGLDVLLSMRLHANLVAHRLRVPCVGFAYDPKLTEHFAEIDRHDVCLPLDVDAAQLQDTITKVLAEEGLPQATLDKISEIEARSLKRLREVSNQISATPGKEVVWGIPQAVGRIDVKAGQSPKLPKQGKNDRGQKFAALPQPEERRQLKHYQPGMSAGRSSGATGALYNKNYVQQSAQVQYREDLINVDLRKCKYDTNIQERDEQKSFELLKGSAWFTWPSDGPDYSQWAQLEIPVDTSGMTSGAMIDFDLSTNYFRPKNKGKIKYQILVNGVVQQECDLSVTRGSFPVMLTLPAAPESKISIRLVSMAAQKKWGWPKASRVRVSDLVVQRIDWSGPVVVKSTNPFWRNHSPALDHMRAFAYGARRSGRLVLNGVRSRAVLVKAFGGKIFNQKK